MTTIFEAWSDQPWINAGAAVRVSLVCFGHGSGARLDGMPVAKINADLTGHSRNLDLTQAKKLPESAGIAFQGPTKVGAFDIPGELARLWLVQPNPHGIGNSAVLKPYENAKDITGRGTDSWLIDFYRVSEPEAALYEAPFDYVAQHVKPKRAENNREAYRKYWWIHAEARPGLRTALVGRARYIATPRVAKYRFFVWLPAVVLPDTRLYAICRDDDITFGILSSRFHEAWALANASRHGVGNDPTYNVGSCFETFPFPSGLTPDIDPARYTNPHAGTIGKSAVELNELRDSWLNPPEWIDRVPEVIAGYPDRIVAKPSHQADLEKRTMTDLYNARPTWLDNAHKALDVAVAQAYGWTDYTPEMSDEEILRRLLDLNQRRASGEAA
jgi:type II restriction/modification system DNA methylase subunit YeeA